MPSTHYDPLDWYWIVNGDQTRFFSSKSGTYVTSLPRGFFASPEAAQAALGEKWNSTANLCTRIANEYELEQVLAPHGKTVGREFEPEEVRTALERIDRGKVDQAIGAGRPALNPTREQSLQTLAASLMHETSPGVRPSPPRMRGQPNGQGATRRG